MDCTENHKFSVVDDTGERQVVQTSELEPGMRLPKYKMADPGGIALTDAYTLGVALGDGYVDGDTVVVKLHGVKLGLPIVGSRGRILLKKGYAVHSQRVRSYIEPKVLNELRSEDPDNLNWLFTLDRKSLLSFFAGWFDTDGSECTGGGIRLYLSGEERGRRTQLLLTKAGVKSTLCLMARKGDETNYGVRNKDIWYLQVSDGRSLPCKRVDVSGGHEIVGRKGEYQKVKVIEVLPGLHDTYCFDEPEKHMGVFANVLTHQCNLVEQALCNMDSEEEFVESSRLAFRAAKRVTLEHYHHDKSNSVIKRNRRVGVGITGCLASPLFNPATLDRAYAAIQREDEVYSKELQIPRSIRTTVVKPSGTMSKVFDCDGYEGIHPAFSRYIIQRVRFAANDKLIPILRAAGHRIEPVVRFDGTLDQSTLVVDFYVAAPSGYPVADEDWDTWKQLDVLKLAQRYWADQSCSVTVYYRKEDIPRIKQWLSENLQFVKTISFLCHSDHGFKQAPKEKISREQYEKLSATILPIDFDDIGDGELESQECAGGVCPVK